MVKTRLAIITILIFSTTPIICFADDNAGDDGQEYTFNSNFIVGATTQTDLKRFNTSELQPGTYSIDVYNNAEWKGLYELKITRNEKGKTGLCYTAEMLENFGVDLTKLNKDKLDDKTFCGSLSEWSNEPTFKDNLNSSQLRLDINVPQTFENAKYIGYVSPAQWDKGITGLNVAYTADYYNILKSKQGDKGQNAYMGVQGYLSSGGWQLHHTGNVNWQDNKSPKWTSNQTTLQRPLATIKSLLTMGQFGSNGDMFEPVNLLGANLATDNLMYPDSLQGYAPVINGVAETNALVTVFQNNSLIYQKTVVPGPFSLTDVYPTGSGSDLVVTVREADGREKTFTIPYNSVVKLLHPGMSNYALTVGKANDSNLRNQPTVGLGTWRYGLNNTFTLYGGVAGFNEYQTYQLGSGMNTWIGGLSLDVTQAKTHMVDGDVSGQQYRVIFNRSFAASGTSISVQVSQATEHYYSINSALYIIDRQKEGIAHDSSPQKSDISYTFSQQFPDGWGGLYFNGSLTRYWHRSGTEKQYSLGYNNSWGKLTWGINLQRVYSIPDKNSNDFSGSDAFSNNGLAPASPHKKDDIISLTFSYPLSFGENRSASISSNSSFKNGSFDNTQIGINGTLNKENTLSYGINGSATHDKNYNLGLDASYISPWSALSGSYSIGNGFQQVGANASGTVLVHSGGVTLSPEMGQTLALAEAKGAKGASISGTNSHFDSNGYALISSLQPYRVNNIEVDMKGASDDVSLDSANMQVVPYEGSITKVVFKTKNEKTHILLAYRRGKVALPFGAEITDEQGNSIGFVGQGSNLYINSNTARQARIAWDGGQCEISPIQLESKEQICI